MFKVTGFIAGQYDIGLMVIAALVCILACYTLFNTVARAHAVGGPTQLPWLLVGAFVIGSGIWITLFIIQLAHISGIPTNYDARLTALSILAAFGIPAIGLAWAMKRASAIIAGVTIGLAIIATHCIGMVAMHMPLLHLWEVDFLIAFTLPTIGLCIFACWLTSQYRHPRGWAGAACLLALAVFAAHFAPIEPSHPDMHLLATETSLIPKSVAIIAALIAVLTISPGLVGAILDERVTQRREEESRRLKQHVQELEATKLELEQTATHLKFALEDAQAANVAKTQFLATMSHELRTPLNAIIGFSEVLKNEIFGPVGSEKYKDYHADILDSGKHLLHLIDDILDMTQTDTGYLKLFEEEIELPDLLETSIRQMQPMADRAKVELQMGEATDLPLLWADSKRMQQILHNLISNAIKFTHEGGKVVIDAAQAEDGLTIRIRDTGIGMAREDIPIALERFGQIDNSLARKYQGSGIGLPLAKQLVELHGGTLSIDSEPGKGTLVTLRFPAHRLRAARKRA